MSPDRSPNAAGAPNAPGAGAPDDFGFQPYSRQEWAALAECAVAPVLDIHRATEAVQAAGQAMAPDELASIYLPLVQLLSVRLAAQRDEQQRMTAFLGQDCTSYPFVLGVTGSVAVGKSATAAVLQALLGRLPGEPNVELVSTDAFLYPNAVLEARGLMTYKGFPESYDQPAMIRALTAIRAGQTVAVPVYSHRSYDIVPGQTHVLHRSPIVVVDGLNVLQANTSGVGSPVVSDCLDFSIYVDAAEEDIARWFEARARALRAEGVRVPGSFFGQFATLSDEEFRVVAHQVWTRTNLVNLREHVAPTRLRASLVLEKDGTHRVQRVLLRRA